MAKKQQTEEILNYTLDDTIDSPELIPISRNEAPIEQHVYTRQKKQQVQEPIISCLRNERVIVKYINKPNNNIRDPKHVAYGGLIDTASITYTVPMLRSGALSNVLTDSEKSFLEEYMGLEYNALSVYKKTDNYWANFRVRLTKSDTYLDLSVPEDYIKYKVLLANKDYICPSLKDLEDKKKATYRFYIVNEGEEIRQTNDKMTISMEASMMLGTLLEDKQTLKLIVETIQNKSISKQSKIDFIKAQAFECVQSNPKLFVSLAKDPFLKTKVLLAECLENGIVRKRNDLYYISTTGEPMCESGEESTLSVAAKYLNSPKRQEVKLTLEAKLKAIKE